jgi:hypothetical protein
MVSLILEVRMRQGMNTAMIAAAAVVLSAAYYSPAPTSQPVPGVVRASAVKTPKVVGKARVSSGTSPCKAYEDPPSPNTADGSSYGDALTLWRQFEHKGMRGTKLDVKFVIALAPDPIHTHLSGYFDRTMDAIQAAAQDEHFVYDSSWLPWKGDIKSFPIRSDEENEEAAIRTQEGCPGLLLFRRQTDSKNASEPYSSGLAVFVVVDEPTRGINPDEWNQAVKSIVESDGKIPEVLQVLGPTFSGSLPSLGRLLQESSRTYQIRRVRIYSGAIWGCDSISQFQVAEDGGNIDPRSRLSPLTVDFGVFSENSERQIYRLLMYFRSQKQSLNDVAIISEDETAYGGSDASTSHQSCQYDYGTSDTPVWLFYPRDISAVRSAYLKQSIFSRGSKATEDKYGPANILHAVAPAESNSETDTITSYSGDEVALDEEAHLFELVSFLRSHHTHYLVLRSSNPDDFLFLARFFKHTYPEGRVITLGSDELFRREVDTSEFRGVMALTNYPLLPRDQHWTRLINSVSLGRHVHRIFAADTMQGEYMAGRFLLDPKDSPGREDSSMGYPYALQTQQKGNLPDYADPVWLFSSDPQEDPRTCFSFIPCYLPKRNTISPPTWLVAAGRDGNWPIAVLNDDEYAVRAKGSKEPKAFHLEPGVPPAIVSTAGLQWLNVNEPRPSGSTETMERIAPTDKDYVNPPPSTVVKIRSDNLVYYWPKSGRPSPVPWRIALFGVASLGLLHAFGLWNWLLGYRYRLKAAGLQEVFLLFHPSVNIRKEILLGIANGLVFSAALMLLIGPWLEKDVWKLNYGDIDLWLFSICFSLLFGMVLAALYVSRIHRTSALLAFLSVVAASGLVVLFFASQDNGTDHFSLLYRSAHLTSGVSPTLPILLMLGGLYLSTMLSLREINLLISAPERLPRAAGESDEILVKESKGQCHLEVLPTSHAGSGPLPKQYSWISLRLGCQIDASAVPLSGRVLVWGPPLALAVLALGLFREDAGSLTLEGPHFSYVLLVCFILLAAIAISYALNLHQSWVAMRLMLRALGRQPLRRTFAALRQCPESSIWALGSGARSEQMRGLSNQLESLTHLRNSLKAQGPNSASNRIDTRAGEAIEQCLFWGGIFMENYAADGARRDPENRYGHLRRWLGRAAEDVMNWILLPAWEGEQKSLNLKAEPSKEGAGKDTGPFDVNRNVEETRTAILVTAEEFICQVYVAYTKTVLSSIRSSAMCIAVLFMAIGAAISSYPILSRTTVVFTLLVVVISVFILIARVYVEMARDEILSLMTGTNPGELGGEFWIKILGFGVGPLVGLVAAQFPAFAETIFSVLGPSLNGPK